MGDYYQQIVDPEVSLDDAPLLAEKVVNWLVERKIILPELTKHGYLPAENYFEVVDDPTNKGIFHLSANHLQITIGRTVFHSNYTEKVICPFCDAVCEQSKWLDAIAIWYYEETDALTTCDTCHQSAPILEWQFVDFAWGFGNLGFSFMNWATLKPAFVEEMQEFLNHRIVYVVGKI